MDIPLFAQTQLTLLQAEQASEVAEQTALLSSLPPSSLQRHGLALLNLRVAAQRTGLGGRTVLELEPDAALTADGRFSSHGIRSGDIVRISEQPGGAAKKTEKASLKEKGVEGVVHRISENKLTIAVSSGKKKGGGGEDDDDAGVEALVSSGKRLWAVKMANEVTFRRMEHVMGKLKEIGEKQSTTQLMRVLFGHTSPSPPKPPDDIKWLDEGLNDSQKEAVKLALGSPEIALIHGPPGTGKTQTLLEIIRQLTSPPHNMRVLVCGPSNISVDNIILRLPPSLPSLRLGHPARLLPRVVEKSLDVLSQTSEAGEIVKDVRTELDSLLAKLITGGKNRLKGKDRKQGWDDVRSLRGEFRQREARATKDLIDGSKVVLSTLHGAGGKHLSPQTFDILIIDESSQALEAQSWIPLLLAKGITKLILAGDHLQLPPTVKSTNTKPPKITQPKEKRFYIPTSLETTLFSRLLQMHGESIKRMLEVQYRMHDTICRFPSKQLYGGKLVSAQGVKARLLKELPGVEETEDTIIPLVFIDTQGGDFPEAPPPLENSGPESSSHSNPNEASLAITHVKSLLSAGVPESEIAVITPYNGQLSLLSAGLREEHPGLELGSVDGFQGREKEAVVVNLVRSNDKRETGFLKDSRRLNVAFTRARRHLCVIGDSDTVKHAGGFLGGWVKWIEKGEEGEVEVRYPEIGEILG